MGMVAVVLLAANTNGFDATRIRSTLRRTRSAASSGRRSFIPSAHRNSFAIFFSSIHHSLHISYRNAYKKAVIQEAVVLSRTPMRWIFPSCCAGAETLSAKRKAPSAKPMTFFFMSFPRFLTLCSLPHALCVFLPNHSIPSLWLSTGRVKTTPLLILFIWVFKLPCGSPRRRCASAPIRSGFIFADDMRPPSGTALLDLEPAVHGACAGPVVGLASLTCTTFLKNRARAGLPALQVSLR